jgi:hypothetical protein
LHLQVSNIFTTAMRERLPKSNPLRSFLVPFTYGTISINDAARLTLVMPNSWLPRAFPFNDAGLQLGWANAFRFLPDTIAAPGTKKFMFQVFDRGANCRAKMDAGVQTEYWRQVPLAPGAPKPVLRLEGPLPMLERWSHDRWARGWKWSRACCGLRSADEFAPSGCTLPLPLLSLPASFLPSYAPALKAGSLPAASPVRG